MTRCVGGSQNLPGHTLRLRQDRLQARSDVLGDDGTEQRVWREVVDGEGYNPPGQTRIAVEDDNPVTASAAG